MIPDTVGRERFGDFSESTMESLLYSGFSCSPNPALFPGPIFEVLQCMSDTSLLGAIPGVPGPLPGQSAVAKPKNDSCTHIINYFLKVLRSDVNQISRDTKS